LSTIVRYILLTDRPTAPNGKNITSLAEVIYLRQRRRLCWLFVCLFVCKYD